MRQKKNHEHPLFLENHEKLIEEYENLRLFAIGKKASQGGYNCFVRQGMALWMSNKTADITTEKKTHEPSFENELGKAVEPEIVRTIADILLKKMRGQENDEPSKNTNKSFTTQCLFVH